MQDLTKTEYAANTTKIKKKPTDVQGRVLLFHTNQNRRQARRGHWFNSRRKIDDDRRIDNYRKIDGDQRIYLFETVRVHSSI